MAQVPLVVRESGARNYLGHTTQYPRDNDGLTAHAMLFHCALPAGAAAAGRAPVAVSLVNGGCDRATNMLKVHYDPLEDGQGGTGLHLVEIPAKRPRGDFASGSPVCLLTGIARSLHTAPGG